MALIEGDFDFLFDLLKDYEGSKAIVTDPPYNIDWKYPSYKDNKSDEEYLELVDHFFNRANKFLDRGEYCIIFINDKYEADYQVIAKRNGFYKRDHIIWHYTFGQHTESKFTLSKTHILYFVKGRSARTDKPVFNWEAVKEESERAKRNDIRFRESGKRFRTMRDVWTDIPRLVWNNYEWLFYSNQLPEKLVERVIAPIYNDKDFLVVDPFMGTGTIPYIAHKMGLKYYACDIDDVAYDISKIRMQFGTKFLHDKLVGKSPKDQHITIKNLVRVPTPTFSETHIKGSNFDLYFDRV